MIAVLARILAGPLFDWLKSRGDAQVTLAEIEARIEQQLAAASAGVIEAEIAGESWLQRNWRPVVALTAFFSYWFVIFVYPFLAAAGILPGVRFGEAGLQNFFYLTTLCVGGYIGSRTVEKIMRK